MASRPSYDANLKWEKIDKRNHPFMNRALSPYPPGSIFKVVTLSAALESKKIKLTEMLNCRGGYRLGLRYAKCWLERGHGLLDPLEGLVWSCDVVFYELGKRSGPDLMNVYAKKSSLGDKLGIDLPQEKKGFIPTSSWKKDKLKEVWYDGDSINMAIGQGFVQVTPLQMAALYSQVATGKLYKPYVVEKIVNKEGEELYKAEKQEGDKIDIYPKTLKLIRQALREVVRRGTGVAARVSGIPAAGKTGTAENPGKPHAWFICYAPYDDPEIVISSFVAHGEHGDQAPAYIARDILTWYKENRLKKYYRPERPVYQYILHGRRVEMYRVKPETPSEE
jgi:penicillin-binding protein 2